MVATFHRSGKSPFYTALRPVARRMAGRLAVRCAVSEAARATASEALGGPYEVGFNGVEVDGYRRRGPLAHRPAHRALPRPTRAPQGPVVPAPGLRPTEAAGEGAAVGRRTGPPVLWIAGDGPETADLRRLHPESDRVRWLGVLSEEEKVRRLVAADVLCAPSIGGESFGMVLVEAMAAGTAVVASDIDGYRDAAGGHAVLVPPGDAGALSRALAGVLAGGATGSEEAGEWASHWSMDGLAAWYEGIYRDGHGPPGRMSGRTLLPR